MESKLSLYNTLTRRKEVFEPLNEGRVGMYVCGPTVYGDPHLGHARPSITFDLMFRYLKSLGYKVRYVRNITDVGHLEHDADEGEDKIAKKARLEQLEPMEVAHYYTERYHKAMEQLGVQTPSIEPHASGHIMEQIDFVQRIFDAGYAYESNGSVYFDVEKYNKTYHYGKLSGRNLEDIVANTRDLDGQSDKRNSFDFALWKKAAPEHIMRWKSPWSDGFPGWHMECSAMSCKYLGEQFDIHGGGMDLMFPHHECEIAQATAALGKDSARYWVHNNMITIDGQKMGKSYGNFITMEQLFNGSHPKLEQAYSPMTIRFFILQAHYRSTLDFSNAALQAAEKGFDRLMKGVETLGKLKPSAATSEAVKPAELEARCREAMDDDLNSPMVISALFDYVRIINQIAEGQQTISEADLVELKRIFDLYVFEILGLRNEKQEGAAGGSDMLAKVVDMILAVRQDAKANKDWATSDKIRNELTAIGIRVKDRKDGVDWELE
ncbi:MAG: cysteine--tRNA ligase [Alistipes sp.]|nr:cysteine--tRNA ligase [Alistipes sp.]